MKLEEFKKEYEKFDFSHELWRYTLKYLQAMEDHDPNKMEDVTTVFESLVAENFISKDKLRSVIPKIHGGGNARRMLESLLDNKSE